MRIQNFTIVKNDYIYNIRIDQNIELIKNIIKNCTIIEISFMLKFYGIKW